MITRMGLLICDGYGGFRCSSGSHEHFGRKMPYEWISQWCRDNGWKITNTDRWRHTCETCECRRKGLSDDYRERLQA